VPDNDMLILDLFSEVEPYWNTTDSYFGKPFIWNMLHDFGGNQGLDGAMQVISEAPLVALNATNLMVGMGLTMEGINQNEIIYHLMLEMAWTFKPINTSSWVQSFIRRRYGRVTPSITKAWEILRTSVYSNPSYKTIQGVVKSIAELRPQLTGMLDRTGHHSTKITYDPRLLIQAWDLLSKSAFSDPTLLVSKSFRYDLVDVTRQMFANLMIPLYENLLLGTTASQIKRDGDLILDLLTDLDRILMTNENFLLSNWIGDAKRLAGNETVAVNYTHYLEYQARNQITLWGPDGEITDYASKQWGGLVLTYYRPRWETFIRHVIQSSVAATPFNKTAYEKDLWESVEMPWQTQVWGASGEPWGTKGSTLRILAEIRLSWGPVLRNIYRL